MKTLNLLLMLLILIDVAKVRAENTQGNSPTFSFEIRLISPNKTAKDPIQLEVKLTNDSDEPVQFPSLSEKQFLDLSFETPTGWVPKTQPRLRSLNGWLAIVTLSKGQSNSGVIDLHDYFSSITPGKLELHTTLKIWLEGGQAEKPIILRSSIPLEITQP